MEKIMSKGERKKELLELINKVKKQGDQEIIQFYNNWLAETNSKEIPITPLEDWCNACDKYNISAKDIICLCDWHYYAYSINGKILSTEYIADSFNCGDFEDCLNYYAENIDRFNKAMAILNGDKYIINSSNYDIYI